MIEKIKKNNKSFLVKTHNISLWQKIKNKLFVKEIKQLNKKAFFNHFWMKVKNCQWEEDTYKIFDKFIDKKNIYIDIGAWIGPTVLYGSQLAKHCYAIEPDPVAFEELQKNVNLNENFNKKITLCNCAISNTNNIIKLGSDSKFGNSESSIFFKEDSEFIKVKCLTFEEFIKQNKIINCSFIKIDIEGGEAIILK